MVFICYVYLSNSYLFSSHSGFNMDKGLVQNLDVFLSVPFKKYFLRKIFIIFSKAAPKVVMYVK